MKLTPEQWSDARRTWEQDDREGYTWLVKELALPVSVQAVRKQAQNSKQPWAKIDGAPGVRNRVEIIGQPSAGAKRHEAVSNHAGVTISELKGNKRKIKSGEASGEFSGGSETPKDGAVTIRSEANARAGARGEEPSPPTEVISEDYDIGGFEDVGLCDLLEAVGRGKYTPKLAGVVYRLALLGLTHEQIAGVLGIAESTVYEWKSRHVEFRMALLSGMAIADSAVVKSLYRTACGYSHPSEVVRVLADGTVVRVATTKHYPPDTQAGIFLLKNRQPELWKERVEVKEQPTIALVDKQAMDDIYQAALSHAAKVQERMVSRAERLGLTIDHALDDGE